MALRKLLKLSAIASALILAGCGGDLVVNTGSNNFNFWDKRPFPLFCKTEYCNSWSKNIW